MRKPSLKRCGALRGVAMPLLRHGVLDDPSCGFACLKKTVSLKVRHYSAIPTPLCGIIRDKELAKMISLAAQSLGRKMK